MSAEGDEANFYCSYCDDFAERQPCARCGLRALSMRPVRDAYYLASQNKDADHG